VFERDFLAVVSGIIFFIKVKDDKHHLLMNAVLCNLYESLATYFALTYNFPMIFDNDPE